MKKIEIPTVEYCSLYTGLMFLSVIVGYLLSIQNMPPPIDPKSGVRNMQGGDYIRLVFIGSSNCPYCNDATHAAIRTIKERLRIASDSLGYGYLTTGISVDMNGDLGKRYLEKSGSYDELIAGASWYNLGIDRYNWDVFPHPASTPQVLITKVTLEVLAGEGGIETIGRDEIVLRRFVGFEGVEELASLSKIEKFGELKHLLGL